MGSATFLFACGVALCAFSRPWTAGPSLPVPRTEVQVASLGTRLFVLGGYPKADETRVDVFDAATGKWSAAAPLPAGGNHLAVASGDGHVYVFGGWGAGEAKDDAFIYDAAADRWARLATFPARCAAGAAVFLDGKVHVAGGACKASPDSYPDVTTHWVLDPAKNAYAQAAPIPLPREHFSLIAADGKLYAIGGRQDVKTNELADVEVYDPSTDRWRQVAPLPEKRSGYAAAYFNGRIVVIGGDNGTEQHQQPSHAEVFAYDVAANQWSRKMPLPYGVHGTGAAVSNGRLYLPAGSKMGGHDFPLATMLILAP